MNCGLFMVKGEGGRVVTHNGFRTESDLVLLARALHRRPLAEHQKQVHDVQAASFQLRRGRGRVPARLSDKE
jgi:hypothetical protein